MPDTQSKGLNVFAPLDGPEYRLRLAKICLAAQKLGVDVHYFGWRRGASTLVWKGDCLVKSSESILENEPKSRLATLLGYARWNWATYRRITKLPPRATIYCLGFETALAAYMASFTRKLRYLFDDADTFSLHAPIPSFLRPMVRTLERRVRRASRVTIIPGVHQYHSIDANMILVRNTPDRSLVQQALEKEVVRPDADLVVYINGWLRDTRGIDTILKVAQALAVDDEVGGRIRFLVAGTLEGKCGEALVKLPNVTFLGQLTNIDALAHYRISDLVLTYYDPSVPINRYSGSNKWGDCIAFGVPPLINSELYGASEFTNHEACLALPYDDVPGLLSALRNLARDGDALSRLKGNMASMREQFAFFDDQIAAVVHTLFEADEK